MIINSHQKVTKIWLDSKASIYNYAFKHTKDREIANEITQQVLMKVYQACFKNAEVQNVRSWLFQIAHNTVIDYRKRQQRIKATQLEAVDFDDQSIWSELALFIEPLIGFLPAKYAVPLKMFALMEIKQTEIAEQLNLSLSATKSRILRAKNLLRQEIEKCCHLETTSNGQILGFSIKENCKPLQEFKAQQLQNANCC